MVAPSLDLQSLRSMLTTMERTTMAVDHQGAEWLYQYLRQHPNLRRTLDVGLGEGASAIAVMLATGGRHTAIDSLQFTRAGLRNLTRFGLIDRLELRAELTCLALPALLRAGRRFDYSFLDAGGKLDDLFVDFHYLSAMTVPGGVILIPDDDRPTVLKFLAYLRHNRPDWQLHPTPRGVRITVAERLGEQDRRHWGDFHDF